jgi:hypothetical protein
MDRWRDEITAWWGGDRVPLAFGVAPLVCPFVVLLGTALTDPSPMSLLGAVFAGLSLLPFVYIGTLLFGVPVYRFLCSRHLTAFWLAPIAGFVAGTGAFIFFVLLVAISLGVYSSLDKLTTLGGLLLGSFFFGGLLGAPIAMIVWLIARPDRVAT